MHNREGYSLIEVSIVLTALLIMVAFCANLVFRTAETRLIDALRTLQIELFCLQQQALASNAQSRINFLLEKSAYQIIQSEKSHIYSLPQNIIFGVKTGTKGPPGKPTALITQPVHFENPYPLAAIIQAHGKISSGTVYLMHTSGRAAGAITITPHQIAHVRVYLFKNSAWEVLTT